MKATFFQLFRFGLVGIGNTAIDACVYIGLTRTSDFFAAQYLLAASVAFVAAGVNSFFWNKHWTFNDGVHYSHAQLVRFFIVALVAFVLNGVILWVLVSMNLNDIIGKLVASVSAGGINFLLQKFWTFPGMKQESPLS